ncbi:MAG: hypothetical protein OXP73_10150 [Chloroflexota bacterium]|nr:hypothetical protein [Chloroflexota bacterium]
MHPLDYSRSYLRWTTAPMTADVRTPGHMPYGNSVRILLDARARVIDSTTGADEEFYLIAPCRTEWMYRDDSCIQQPGGEYRLAWAQRKDRALRFSRDLSDPEPRPQAVAIDERYLELDYALTTLPNPRPATSNSALVAAAESLAQVVVQTEIANERGTRRAVLEYPVKTFNYQPERVLFQMDTGPMLWADLDSSEADPMCWLRLAHTVYNRFDRAEFVLRGPTPYLIDGEPVGQVEDYQQVVAQPARHAFFVAG